MKLREERNLFAPALFIAILAATAPSFAQDTPAEAPTGEAEVDQPAEATTDEAPPAEPAEAPRAASEADLTAEQRTLYDGHLRSGKAAYAAQDFETAFRELEAAHAIFPKPSILFNLALIAEKSGKLDQSVAFYQRFVEAPGVTLEDRQRASERLRAIQDILASTESAEKKQQMTDLLPALEAMGIQTLDEPTTTTTTETAQTTTEPADTTVVADPGYQATPEVKYTWPVYAAFGTASAALAGGVVMIAMTNKRIDEGKQAAIDGDTAGHAKAEEDASLYASTAAGLFAGGAVLAVVGSYFVVKNSRTAEAAAKSESSAPQASLSVSLHKNFLGPILSVSF